MRPHKLTRTSAEAEQDALARALPGDLLLEIIARADAETIVRCAACCKPLRRDILSPGFIRRLCSDPAGGTRADGACLLGFLHAYDKAYVEPRPPAPLTLAHPATPRGGGLLQGAHLPPTLPRRTGRHPGPLRAPDVPPRTRRAPPPARLPPRADGPLRVRPLVRVPCVLPLPAGHQARFAPQLCPSHCRRRRRLLLLSAARRGLHRPRSGICSIKVQIVSSDAADRKWGPVAVVNLPRRQTVSSLQLPQPCCSAVVLGTLIHWLIYGGDRCSMILTYDFNNRTAGSIDLPPGGLLPKGCRMCNLYLTSSPDDGRLRLLVSNQLAVYVWHRSSTAVGWEPQAVISAEPTFSSLLQIEPAIRTEFEGSGARSGTVLLRPSMRPWLRD